VSESDDILQKLREAGLDPENPQWVQKKDVDLSRLPSLARQREILQNLEKILSQQLNTDLDQLEQARENLAKLRRGGGR
jgi:hypothetical protein